MASAPVIQAGIMGQDMAEDWVAGAAGDLATDMGLAQVLPTVLPCCTLALRCGQVRKGVSRRRKDLLKVCLKEIEEELEEFDE